MRFITTMIGYLVAVLLLLIILILVMFQSLVGNQRLFDPFLKLLCRILPAAFGIRIKTSGFDLKNDGKARIFMANHVNIFDPLILYGYIPNFIRSVELEDHFRWPLWGRITRSMGNIPISHTNVANALESLEIAKSVIAQGTSIGILPEGHRTRDGKLQPFLRGPFRLARDAGVDIIPIALKGLWERKSVHSLVVRPGRVEMVIGEPVRSESVRGLTDRELKSKVRDIFETMMS